MRAPTRLAIALLFNRGNYQTTQSGDRDIESPRFEEPYDQVSDCKQIGFEQYCSDKGVLLDTLSHRPQQPPRRLVAGQIRERLPAGDARRLARQAPLPELVRAESGEAGPLARRFLGLRPTRLQERRARLRCRPHG